jgi:molybdopterin synthase sulfur carrier subunit
MATLRLPRMLSDVANGAVSTPVTGETVAEALADLFHQKPGLRNHILDDSGSIRPHVSVFVDGRRADLSDSVDDRSQIRVLHAVSGG